MSTDRGKALEKIRKLLRVAKDGRGNATEAETAMRQALALMRLFNIDDAEVSAKEIHNDPEAISRAWCKAGYGLRATLRKMPLWANILATGVARLYECRLAILRREEEGMVIMFGGYRTDLQVAVWTFEYLVQSVRRGCDNFDAAIKKGDVQRLMTLGLMPEAATRLLMATPKARKIQFRDGMCGELQNLMFKMAKERAEEQKKTASANALVIAKEAALVARFGIEKFKDTPSKSMNAAQFAALQAGRAEGQRTNLSPNPVGHTPAAAPLLVGKGG